MVSEGSSLSVCGFRPSPLFTFIRRATPVRAGRAPARFGVECLDAIFASALRVRARFKGYLRFHLHWRCGAAKRPRTRTTTRTRTIGEAEDGDQDPRWRVPSASKRSINRVNIATTRVWLFLLASSASPIVLVLVV